MKNNIYTAIWISKTKIKHVCLRTELIFATLYSSVLRGARAHSRLAAVYRAHGIIQQHSGQTFGMRNE